MRHIIQEYGQDIVKTFRQWEKLEIKMAEFKKSQKIYIEMLKQRVDTSQH